jgi:hypothetical protein
MKIRSVEAKLFHADILKIFSTVFFRKMRKYEIL